MKLPLISSMDSSTTAVLALAARLHGRDFAGIGVLPPIPAPLAYALNLPPRRIREEFYKLAAVVQSFPIEKVLKIDPDNIARWVVDQYPPIRFCGAAAGSANGAIIYLLAAMGLPWLPQTFLVPVRRRMHPDAIKEDMTWGLQSLAPLLDSRSELFIQQMHDPLQDRLMIQRMAMLRIKLLTMPTVYRTMLSSMPENSPLYIIDCRYRWPRVRRGERYAFQTGGLGELSNDEYKNGGPRVSEFLRAWNSPRARWDPPATNEEGPEAEWGYCEELTDDLRKIADRHRLRLLRIRFEHPESISALVADCYRWWYRLRGVTTSRVVGSCFAVLDPSLMIQTGSIPYWLSFNTNSSAQRLDQYLKSRGPFDECFTMLMSDGVKKIGGASIPSWKQVLKRSARKRYGLFGTDSTAYPSDQASFIQYHSDFKRCISQRIPFPAPLTPSEMERFFLEHGKHHGVELRQCS